VCMHHAHAHMGLCAGWLAGGGGCVLGDKEILNHLGIARFNLQQKNKQHHRTCTCTVDADVDVRCEMRDAAVVVDVRCGYVTNSQRMLIGK
jgi:hypothetical protein